MHCSRFAAVPLAIGLALIVGCEQSSAPTALGSNDPVFAGKPSGGGKVDTHPRAHIVWSDAPHGLVPGIEGDSRDKYGVASTIDEYQGEFCGVNAILYTFDGESGDLNADFNTKYTTDMAAKCGEARYQLFHVGGALGTVKFAPHFIVRGLTRLAVGESRPQFMGFGIQQENCQRVMFDSQYPGVDDAQITRLDDGTTAVRQWLVESRGNHMATCVMSKKNGTLYAVGEPFVLPFSFTVTEVLYPYETYP